MITVYFIRGEEKIPVQVDEGMSLISVVILSVLLTQLTYSD